MKATKDAYDRRNCAAEPLKVSVKEFLLDVLEAHHRVVLRKLSGCLLRGMTVGCFRSGWQSIDSGWIEG